MGIQTPSQLKQKLKDSKSNHTYIDVVQINSPNIPKKVLNQSMSKQKLSI